jgi:hypothetical protein
MLIVDLVGGETGWQPIAYMVNLAAELLEADVLRLDRRKPNLLEKLNVLISKRQRAWGEESCLLICQSPADLLCLYRITGWQKRFRYIAAWVIDSFWTEWIPKTVRLNQPFDHLFVTTEEDVPIWNQITHTPTTCLPWGSDVLRLGGAASERTWDLTRVGRQPPEWENDQITQEDCAERNLRFHGRPRMFDNATQNQMALMQLYRQTKFLLAFSNSVNPMNYTHPHRDYLTGRWVDALACGAVVAGVRPKSTSANRLLWSGATIDLGTIHREEGLQIIAEAVRDWTPAQAAINYHHALERLDWRWRFAAIADTFQESPKPLQNEIQQLHQKIRQQQPAIRK